MKKLFLLIPALIFSMMMSADVIYINTGTADALRKALNNANDGDIIEMAGGTYVESPSNYIAFDGKHVTVRAAEGAEVLIQPQVPITISNGGCAHFKNVKIDASHLMNVNNWYSHSIYPTDANDNNRIILEGCEMYGFNLVNSAIYCSSSNKLDAVSFSNCYFHNMMKSVLFIESTAGTDVQISNSTFANIETASSYSAGVIDTRATSGSFSVDHCTFYNCKVINTDYGTIGKVATPGAVVSNCIFAMPESTADLRAIRDVAQANNCLTFNYTKDSGKGIHGDVVKNNCIFVDPLFTDATNEDYSFAGNWVTMSISPARYAGTDGSDLGDPRWYSAEILPATSFASDYNLLPTKAMLSGRIELNANDKIHFKHNSVEANGTAKWKLHVEKSCIVSALVDVEAECTSGRQLTLTVKDADGNTVATLAQASATYNDNDIDLGQISFSEEGDYTFILTNSLFDSGVVLEKITLSYVGGDVQAMPGTTDIDDAWFSSNGTRTAGEYISFADGTQDQGWVKWNVSFASAANYNVKLNVYSNNGKKFTVALQDADGNDIVTPLYLNGGDKHATDPVTLEMGAMEVPAGNYILKVTNAEKWSDAKLISVKFEYAGGAAVDLSKDAPANLLANADAIVSDDWSIEGGKITHAESKALTGWAKWNVNSADYGNYNVTVNISCDNGHGVRVEVFEDEAQPAIYTLDEPSAGKYHTGDLALDLGSIVLADREYVVKVSNTVSSSHVQIASIVISYLNGARATLPASCAFADVMLSEKAHVTDGNLWFNTIGDSNPVGQWAKWNVKAATAGTFLFTMNVSSTNGQSYKISILDMNENELDAFESGSVGTGDNTVKHYFNLAAGNYIVKLENTYPWSQGHIVSLAVTQPELIVLDEMAATNAVIVDNYRNGTHDIQITRSIVSGMYNTICLPFDVDNTQLKAIFGSDVELIQMQSATLSGNALTLNFEDAASIYRGTPYLIKTAKAVVNPVFTDVEIKEKVGQATVGTDANFIGNFIAGEVPAGDQNLFLGPNDLLYFSQNATPIKGMRAYFHVNVPGAANNVKAARIIKGTQVITEINLVGDENKAVKTIENGQLVITFDGVRYNVMGTKIQ